MDSEIKILTINGELVRTLNTQSKKTFWDGKDYTGKYVQSGIYLLVAKSLTTKESAVHKIAVINK
jgi:flagellar hook assembly protein FlgD